MILSPSILAADFSRLGEDIKKIENAGAQWVHIDVMDGHFVPNISFGPLVVDCVSKISNIVKDVHLMIQNPEKYVDAFLKAGADIITVHHEADMDYEYVKNAVKNAGKLLGISIKPKTDVSEIKKYLDDADMILLMSVEPGFGGQKFMPESIERAKEIRKIYPEGYLQIDGGINLQNAPLVVEAGVNVLVAGSSVFGAEDIDYTVKEFIRL